MAADSRPKKTKAAAPAASEARPDFGRERALLAAGARLVCGVDEVGRGPLAGPVVVAAVVLPETLAGSGVLDGINDSKLLSAAERERLCQLILAEAAVSVVAAPPPVIRDRNILGATLWAMAQAVAALPVAPDHALIDGNMIPKGLPCPATALVGGDGLSLSIAAASIVAKVTRDRMCALMHEDEPHFGFLSHKGYSAPQHMAALDAFGPGRHHRMDFAPCRAAHEKRILAETGALPAINPVA